MSTRAYSIRSLFLIFLLAGIVSCSNDKSNTSSSATEITMYKNQGCMCCAKWADYLGQNGFDVTQKASPNMQAIKSENDVPYDLGACHTAIVGDYVVEGHVPAEDIKNLLEEQPDAKGIAVPGMPTGSPGMEMPGRTPDPYKVYLFKEDGSRQVYAQH